jgi:hypothetical protein
VILFHHIAGALLLAAPAHSAAAALRVASPCIATQHHALRRTTSRRLATQHRATQRNFKRNPTSPQHTPFKFPWRDQTQPWVTVPSQRCTLRRVSSRCPASLFNATNNRIVVPRTATLRFTALLTTTLRFTALLTTTQRNNHLGE